jgi:hypothetical protein
MFKPSQNILDDRKECLLQSQDIVSTEKLEIQSHTGIKSIVHS